LNAPSVACAKVPSLCHCVYWCLYDCFYCCESDRRLCQGSGFTRVFTTAFTGVFTAVFTTVFGESHLYGKVPPFHTSRSLSLCRPPSFRPPSLPPSLPASFLPSLACQVPCFHTRKKQIHTHGSVNFFFPIGTNPRVTGTASYSSQVVDHLN
jgi:hypothetical protein